MLRGALFQNVWDFLHEKWYLHFGERLELFGDRLRQNRRKCLDCQLELLLVLWSFNHLFIRELSLPFWLAALNRLSRFFFSFGLLEFLFRRDTKVSITCEKCSKLWVNFVVVFKKFVKLASELLHCQFTPHVFVNYVMITLVDTSWALGVNQVIKLGTQLLLKVWLKVVTTRILTMSLAKKRSGINSMKMLRRDSFEESTLYMSNKGFSYSSDLFLIKKRVCLRIRLYDLASKLFVVVRVWA